MKTLLRIAPVLALGVALASRAVAQNLIQDGSFEHPVIGGDSYITNPFYPGSGASWQGGVIGITSKPIPGFFGPTQYGLPAAQDGNQYVEIANDVVLSQQFNVATSGQYTLTWWDNLGVPDGPPSDLGITPKPGYSVSIGGATHDFVPVATAGWTQESLHLTLQAGSDYTLAFQGPAPEYRNSYDAYNWLLLDNVDLEGPSGSSPSVPDHGCTSVLLGGALAVVAFARRRFGQ